MLPSLKRLAVAAVWTIVTTAAAFFGGAVTVVGCSWDTNDLRLAELATLALLPGIVLYFVLDWWWPESRARQIGFTLPLIAEALLLGATFDVRPQSIDGMLITQYAVAFAGSIVAVWLAMRAKRRIKALNIRSFQFGLSSLFVVVTLVAVLCACLKTFGATAGSLACGWAVAVVLLMIAVQGVGRSPRRGWLAACLLATTAVYGPHLIVAVHTWLFNSCDHCRWTWFELLWVMPGGIVEVLFLRGFHGLPGAVAIAIAAVLSLAIVGVTAWLAKRGGRGRWVALAIVSCLAVWLAMAADAIMRA